MSWWSDRVVPHLVDRACGLSALRQAREAACAGLRGTVLEVGYGSGLNACLYPDAVTQVLAVEPSDLAWSMSAARRDRDRVAIHRVGLDGQRLPLEDASVDSVLCTFTLCTIPDPAAALAEIRRVLRPGAGFGFAEHGLSPDAGVARWQRRLDGLEQRLAGGCHLVRDAPALLRAAGFELDSLRQAYVTGMPAFARPWTYCSVGRARLA